jgi:hypothetical protein
MRTAESPPSAARYIQAFVPDDGSREVFDPRSSPPGTILENPRLHDILRAVMNA